MTSFRLHNVLINEFIKGIHRDRNSFCSAGFHKRAAVTVAAHVAFRARSFIELSNIFWVSFLTLMDVDCEVRKVSNLLVGLLFLAIFIENRSVPSIQRF